MLWRYLESLVSTCAKADPCDHNSIVAVRLHGGATLLVLVKSASIAL